MQPILQALPLWAQVALAVVPALGALFAAFGLLLNVQQSRRTNAQARAALAKFRKPPGFAGVTVTV
jgi:hypothetical protein